MCRWDCLKYVWMKQRFVQIIDFKAVAPFNFYVDYSVLFYK